MSTPRKRVKRMSLHERLLTNRRVSLFERLEWVCHLVPHRVCGVALQDDAVIMKVEQDHKSLIPGQPVVLLPLNTVYRLVRAAARDSEDSGISVTASPASSPRCAAARLFRCVVAAENRMDLYSMWSTVGPERKTASVEVDLDVLRRLEEAYLHAVHTPLLEDAQLLPELADLVVLYLAPRPRPRRTMNERFMTQFTPI